MVLATHGFQYLLHLHILRASYLRHRSWKPAPANQKPKRMKRILTLSFLLTAMVPAFAQKHVYEDLLAAFVDENYEKCLFKAIGYTESDATKKDPMPYLYASMCYYEMSKIEKFTAMEEYKKADREALKYAEKYRKKDKDKEFFGNYDDYWTDLNSMAQEKGLNHFDAKEWSKAKQLFDAMTSYYPENPGAWVMLALCQYNTNLAKEGDLNMKSFDTAMAGVGDIGTLPEDQKKLLKTALIQYSMYLNTKGMKEEAKAVIEMGKDHFMEDPEFKLQYDELQ
jgi:tetratricopeptide (TPR) repeat protein